jgi:hypothetical protein
MTSSLSSAEVCDRLCVIVSVLGERNDISGRISLLHLPEGSWGSEAVFKNVGDLAKI